jgi:hypothetical protein
VQGGSDGGAHYSKDADAVAAVSANGKTLDDRKLLGLATDTVDPFKPTLIKAMAAGEGKKLALFFISKIAETRFMEKGVNLSDSAVACELESDAKDNLKTDQKCTNPKDVSELTKTFTCDEIGEGDAKKSVTLELKKGSGVFILPGVAHKYTKEELPKLEKTLIEVKVGREKKPAAADAFTMEVKEDGVSAEINFGDVKCTGEATSNPEGLPCSVISLIVVGVLAVVVVAVVMLMPSAEDDEDDDEDDDNSSDENKDGKNEP